MEQEYFIRHKDGCTLDTENERHKLSLCLIAAIERRISHVIYVFLIISLRKYFHRTFYMKSL